MDASRNSATLLPLYIIDPDAPFAQSVGLGAGCLRANFVLESMKEIDDKLRTMGSQMVVIVGSPKSVLPQVLAAIDEDDVDLYYEREPAAPVRESDRQVLKAIQDRRDLKCEIRGYDTHTLHPMETYLAKCKGGAAPATYGGFTKIFQSMLIPKEVDDVKNIPHLPPKAIENLKHVFGDKLYMPTLEDIGYDKEKLQHRTKGGIDFTGGEDFALQLLDKMMSRTEWVASFEKPNTSPNALTVDTTGLSPCKLFVRTLIFN